MKNDRARTLTRWTMVSLALAALLGLSAAPSLAQLDDVPEVEESMQRDEDSAPGLFEIVRIELLFFGGMMGGDSYLSLPAPRDENLTFDTGADEIVDFSGAPMSELRSPLKYIEDGRIAGGSAAFYLGKSFGMQLTGSWATAKAVLTGHTATDTRRFVADRTNMDIISIGGNIIYNLGKERKMKLRPYVNLGFGGILNKFPNVDDVGAVYFLYGGGLSYPVVNNFRVELIANWRLFSYDTDEIALDEIVTFPSLLLGFSWRHDVPENDVEEVPPVAEEAGS